MSGYGNPHYNINPHAGVPTDNNNFNNNNNNTNTNTNDTWDAIQKSLPAINAAGFQLSASAGMNTAYGQPAMMGPAPLQTSNNEPPQQQQQQQQLAPAPMASFDPLQAAGIIQPQQQHQQTFTTQSHHPQQQQQQQQQQPVVYQPMQQSVPTTQVVVATAGGGVPGTAATTQNPYIFLKPQHINPTQATNGGAAPFALPPGTSLDAGGAAAAAAGFVNNGTLLFNPASLFAATTQQAVQVQQQQQQPGQQVHQPGQQQQQQQIPLQVQQQQPQPQTNALPTLILPAAISQQQQQQPMMPHSMSHSQSNIKSPNMNMELLAPPPQMMMMNEIGIAPSVVSSATGGHRSEPAPKRKYNEEALAKVTDPAERRRYERNLREQQRSSKISTQIKELREVLSECNVPFKPNKYSILLKVVEYIKQLQSRAIMLDAEHQKLITTVRQTNEMITNTGKSNNNETGGESSDTTMGIENDWRHGRGTSEIVGSPSQDSELYFVKGIDYRGVFDQCPTAMGIAALDGRILECNTEFQSLLGYTTHEDLLKQSLFNLVHNHQDIFRAMAQMLKTAEDSKSSSNTNIDIQQETNNNASSTTNNNNNDSSSSTKDRFWTGPVTSKQNIQVSV
jgi:PAS domain-containing protein